MRMRQFHSNVLTGNARVKASVGTECAPMHSARRAGAGYLFCASAGRL